MHFCNISGGPHTTKFLYNLHVIVLMVKINFIKHNQKFSGPANCPIGEPFVSKGAGNLYELGNDYEFHRILLF